MPYWEDARELVIFDLDEAREIELLAFVELRAEDDELRAKEDVT